MNIWQEQVTLRFGSVDRSDRLTLGAAFGLFQEAAISHAEVLGVGRDALEKSGQAWVLSRLSVFLERRPCYGETVTVRSWPRGSEKLFALRDYEILDSAGKSVIRGRSGWLVIDTEKRKPLRIQPVIEKLPNNEGLNAFVSGPTGLSAREKLLPFGERLAAYSDIDYYGHMNNVSYVLWIQDMTSPDLLDNAGQMRLDINYLSEILPGEKIGLFSAPTDCAPVEDSPSRPAAAFAYEGRRTVGTDGQALFRAELRLGL